MRWITTLAQALTKVENTEQQKKTDNGFVTGAKKSLVGP